MTTPPLPPECFDCGQQPRQGRSKRCRDCRTLHRRQRQAETQRQRRSKPRPTSPAPAVERPEMGPHETDAEIQARIDAVSHTLRCSTLYAQHLHQRIGPTPYLDHLHDAVNALLTEMQRLGYQNAINARASVSTARGRNPE